MHKNPGREENHGSEKGISRRRFFVCSCRFGAAEHQQGSGLHSREQWKDPVFFVRWCQESLTAGLGEIHLTVKGVKMLITVSNQAVLSEISSRCQEMLQEKLTLKNPKWVENERMGYWNGETPEYLTCYNRSVDGLVIPRGFCRQLITLCNQHHIKYEIDDQRRALPEIEFSFKGQLRSYQAGSARDILARNFGTLSAATGSGKTIVALYIIAMRGQPTLVICHTKELLYQWRDRACQFLGMNSDEIGLVGDGKKTVGDRLTIGIVNSVYKMAPQIRDRIGHLVVDECHRTPSRTFTEAVTAFDSKFMLGLSATPYRRDKLSKLIFWHLGDIVHEVNKKDLIQNGDILKPECISRHTKFQTDLDASSEYSKVLSELTRDESRNRLIVADVVREAKNSPGLSLVISDRKEHCETLLLLLQKSGVNAGLVTGSVSKKQRRSVIEKMTGSEIKVLVATGQLIGEGFDLKELSTLFVTTPIRFEGRVTQYIGRILRPAPGKEKARIYDYVDSSVGVLKASAKARERVYDE